MTTKSSKRTKITHLSKFYKGSYKKVGFGIWQPSKKRNKLNAKSKSSSKGTVTEQT